MNILYVAPRYHTNQVPVMRGWNKVGASVKFLVVYQGTIESREFVDLQVIKPSLFSRIIYRLIDITCNQVRSESWKSKTFIPEFNSIYKNIKDFKPDVVIIREYSFFGLVANMVCRLLKIKNVVIYTQYPIYGRKGEGASLWGRIMMSIAPHVRFSPVLYRGSYRKKDLKTGFANHFIPLICDKPVNERENYCPNGKIRLLDIGKYREYKKHFFVVDALSKVKHPERFELTIIGQLSNETERMYYSRLERYVKEKHLDDIVHLRGHVDYKVMGSIYTNHDVLVLASKEAASVSVLESMSRGLCVLGSYENGTTCYLDEYKCGMSFSNSNIESLIKILDNLYENPNLISECGKKAQEVAKNELCFEKYRKGLHNLLQQEFNYSELFEK